MVQKISPRAVYRLLESFTLWDNHVKKGPWQLEYTKNEKIDCSKFTDAVGFSFKYLEDSNACFNEEIRKIAPILYLIGPIYALKAISELDDDFYASGKAPKGVFKSNASVGEVVDRYTVPAIWLPFLNNKAEENNNGIRFTSDIGPVIDFDWGKKECKFRFGEYEKLLFPEEKTDTENSLRLVNLMLKSELSDSKYINQILPKEPSEKAEPDMPNLDSLFSSLINPAAPPEVAEVSSGFDIQSMFLIPKNYGEIHLYINTMRASFDAIYPSTSFQSLNKEINSKLEEARLAYLDEYPKILELSAGELKNEIQKLEEGIVYVRMTEKLITELGVAPAELGATGTDHTRTLMSMFGEESVGIRAHFKDGKFNMKNLLNYDKMTSLLRIKKTRYLN